MKKKYLILITLFLAVLSISCSDYLDVIPDNIPTIDHAFANKPTAEKYLATCYSYLPAVGTPSSDPAFNGTDEFWANSDVFYSSVTNNFFYIHDDKQNVDSPIFNFWEGTQKGVALYDGIRDCNVFLENIGKVGQDLTEPERRGWIAEVKFLKAYYHYYLLRLYGPICLQKESIPVATPPAELKAYREPFDECVEYIVQLLNEAIPDLPLSIAARAAEMGRITQPVALTLKADVLLTAASPLFNGNPDFAGLVDNRGIKLFKADYDPTKWQRATLACKNAIDTCLLAGHNFYEFAKYTNVSPDTKRLMTLRSVVTERWNNEIIWSENKFNLSEYNKYATPYFMPEQASWAPTEPNFCPALAMVDLFYTRNGVPIEEDPSFDYAGRYSTTLAPTGQKYFVLPGYETAKANIGRETRFYANLAFDGAIWYGNGRFKDVGEAGALATETPWVFKTKKGEGNGRNSNLRFSVTGYYVRKASNYENVSLSATSNVVVPSTFPVYRLADLYLMYAEALNESLTGPNEEVYRYIDAVRARAGLKGVVESWATSSKYSSKPATKEGMREIIQRERMIELAFEGKRYWDIRRWKIAHILLNQPVLGLNADGPTTPEYNVVRTLALPQFSMRNYLTPLSQSELRINKNLVQNPYW